MLLLLGLPGVHGRHQQRAKQIREIYIFAGVLVLEESLPFMSAVAIAILESSRINSFEFWRQHRRADRGTDRASVRWRCPSIAASSQPVASEVPSRRRASMIGVDE